MRAGDRRAVGTSTTRRSARRWALRIAVALAAVAPAAEAQNPATFPLDERFRRGAQDGQCGYSANVRGSVRVRTPRQVTGIDPLRFEPLGVTVEARLACRGAAPTRRVVRSLPPGSYSRTQIEAALAGAGRLEVTHSGRACAYTPVYHFDVGARQLDTRRLRVECTAAPASPRQGRP